MSWEAYFKHHANRNPVPFFIKACEIAEATTPATQAVDLGSGAGIECLELLRRDWHVHAVDGQDIALKMLEERVPRVAKDRITYERAFFEDIQSIPTCDFLYSYHSLPFCKQKRFAGLCQVVFDSLKTGGIFAGTFFGIEDDWVIDKMATGITAEQLDEKLAGFEILHRKEINEMAGTAAGPQKYWHVHEVIARKK